MAVNTLAALDPALKQYYKGGKLTQIAYKQHPFMALVKKEKNLLGRNTPLVCWYANTAGVSSTFTAAQGAATAESTKAFLLTPKRVYGVSTIDMLAISAAGSDDATFLKSVTDVVDGTALQVGNQVARQLYGNFGNARGKIAVGGVSSATITLANPGDIVNFEVGMRIRQSTTDGTSGSLGSGDSTIVGIDRRAGKFTLASGTNFVAGDFLFCQGDFGLGANGIRGWVPTTAPTVGGGDSFLGVDRAADSRLYGQYIDVTSTGDTIESAIGKMDVSISREGGSMSHVFLNPLDFDLLRQSLGSQVVYDKAKSPDMATISFDTLRYAGVKGSIQIVPDADCPQNEAVCTQLDSWVLKSVGEVPHISNANGGQLIAMAAEDSAELRQAAFFELGCYAPAYNGRVKLA